MKNVQFPQSARSSEHEVAQSNMSPDVLSMPLDKSSPGPAGAGDMNESSMVKVDEDVEEHFSWQLDQCPPLRLLGVYRQAAAYDGRRYGGEMHEEVRAGEDWKKDDRLQ
ncbi:hypothetical protein BGW38_010052 [Lunasporangiospora selenospora]|uniref:Uncharacterized protein n=1 Tax=Lunasporangiospora selenospora TaxID=979761 RepID=A0A9P6KIK6_9FUNG|nr:hypothetical protein BGW38_010052 [Lunasporangiospora selenospora]